MYRDKLLLTEIHSIGTASQCVTGPITLEIQKRRVRLQATLVPTEVNAWTYVDAAAQPAAPAELPTFVGPIVNVRKGTPLQITWVNTLSAMAAGGVMQEAPPINPLSMQQMSDMTMNPSVGVVAHLHGAKVAQGSDGWPLEPVAFAGSATAFPQSRTYTYPNDQRATMLWFHDHGMDNTAPQVHAGLAGLYFIRDPSDEAIFGLIGNGNSAVGEMQEIPLVIQDRILATGETKFDYAAGIPASDPAGGRPEFLGDTIFVNGRPSPHHPIDRKVYRLRILNGSNARTYALGLYAPRIAPAMSMAGHQMGMAADPPHWYGDRLTVIGNEAGLFARPRKLGATDCLILAPAERLDVLLDLTGMDLDVDELRLVNLAVSTFPRDPAEPIYQTTRTLFTNDPAVSIAPSIPWLPATPIDDLPFGSRSKPHVNVLQLRISSPMNAAADLTGLDQILLAAADDDGFTWDGGKLVGAQNVSANRLILLMNDTGGFAATGLRAPPHPMNGHGAAGSTYQWKDTQIWELEAPSAAGGGTWPLQFDVSLTSPTPPQDIQIDTKLPPVFYKLARATFFADEPPTLVSDQNTAYATEHVATIKAQQGTCERWYVANVGNTSPTAALPIGRCPDMHPFHVHLVNFIVLRRWRQGADDVFRLVELDRPDDPRNATLPVAVDLLTTGPTGDLGAAQVRHDTIRIEANELVELLVYFPLSDPTDPAKTYTGKYPYHCHLVEHEDMGMMLHFEVS